jgi:DNA-binding CsgD family transcriptional regulator
LIVKEIADRLGLSPYTVGDYLRDAYRRLRARNGTHAVTIAIALGYLDPRESLPTPLECQEAVR